MPRQVIHSGRPNPVFVNQTGTRQVPLVPGAFINESGGGVVITANGGLRRFIGLTASAGIAIAVTALPGLAQTRGKIPQVTAAATVTVAPQQNKQLIGEIETSAAGLTLSAGSGRGVYRGKTAATSAGITILVTDAVARILGATPTEHGGFAMQIGVGSGRWIGKPVTATAASAVPVSVTAAAGRKRFMGELASQSLIISSRQVIVPGAPWAMLLNESQSRQVALPGLFVDADTTKTAISLSIGAPARASFIGKTASVALPISVTAGSGRARRIGSAPALATPILTTALPGLRAARGATPAPSVGTRVTALPGRLRKIGGVPQVEHGLIAQALSGRLRATGRIAIETIGARAAQPGVIFMRGGQVEATIGTGAFATALPGRLVARSKPASTQTGTAFVAGSGRMRFAAAAATGSAGATFTGQPGQASLIGQPVVAQVSVGVVVQASRGLLTFIGFGPTEQAFVELDSLAGARRFIGKLATVAAGAQASSPGGLVHRRGELPSEHAGATVSAGSGLMLRRGRFAVAAIPQIATPRVGRVRMLGSQITVSGISAFVQALPGRARVIGAAAVATPLVPVLPAVTLALAVDQRTRVMPPMSDSDPTLNLLPIDYGAMAVTDTDRAFLLDCTLAMQERGDQIALVGLPTIEREDGSPIGAGDLTASNVGLLPGGLKFGWTFTAGGNVAAYLAAFPITLQSGGRIWRTARIETLPNIG